MSEVSVPDQLAILKKNGRKAIKRMWRIECQS